MSSIHNTSAKCEQLTLSSDVSDDFSRAWMDAQSAGAAALRAAKAMALEPEALLAMVMEAARAARASMAVCLRGSLLLAE